MPAGVVSGSLPVRLLEVDADLARWLSPSDVVEARRRTVVPVLKLGPGRWQPPVTWRSVRDHLGFIALEGLLARDEELAGSTATELIGPGDIVQPWARDPDEELVPRSVTWTVMQTSRLAILGPGFVAAIEPWPQLRTGLLERAMRRCSRLSTHHALSQLSRVDARLLVLFWHLAERWGRVVPGGVVVPLGLSHEALGHLVGAKRPTVTLALQRLRSEELVERRADRTWKLCGDVEDALSRLDRIGCSKPTVALHKQLRSA